MTMGRMTMEILNGCERAATWGDAILSLRFS